MPFNLLLPHPQFSDTFFCAVWKDCSLFLLICSFDFDQVNRIYRYCSLARKNILSIWIVPCSLSGINKVPSLSLLLKIIYSVGDFNTN